ANVPIIEGSDAMSDDDDLFEIAKNIGFPILLKASAGGGGRGIRLVQSEEEFFPHLNQAKNEARLAFNDDRIFIEKYIEKGRHIEVQILGLPDGQVLHFGERDCTIQRKNQKLIEETPAPFMSKQIIKEIHESAINLVSTSNYTNAGTVEFIFDMNSNKFYFLEVNTRIQVEHPVTEMVTGEDLIWRQIQVANGENINLTQEDIKIKGHAIQSRIYAEDPFNGFQPSPGTINRVIHPVGAGVRVDTAIEDGSSVSSYYDSMIAKLIVHSPNRSAAIRKMINNLSNYLITGVHTTVPYIKQVISSPDFSNFSYHTKYLDENKFTIPEEIMDISRIIASKFSMGKNSQQSFQKRISNWKLSSLS
ncbi:MAG: ATP-grasp domain-containing protein, partial [Candidatus Heimdallarchaeota archaeon]|nr:ATP-grasp domain-containing protein [Candidatus Heimdallarchaeota archaeon]